MKKIYLDNAATTKIDKEVLKEMIPYFIEDYGNASSQHLMGKKAKQAIENARKTIADSINAFPYEIIFTSGGTESNNLVLKGLFFKMKEENPEKNHIVTTKIEHDCILNTCKWLEKQGAKVTYLDVDKEGFINLDQLKEAVNENTFLVSIIHANNEVGTIQNLEEIGKICKEKNVALHTDACQSYLKTELDVKKQNLDFITLNSHKIHGPKGVGALFLKDGKKIIPLMHGGGHERKLRSGTENVPGIVGFAEAVKRFKKEDVEKIEILRDKIIEEVLKITNVNVNGPNPLEQGKENKRICNNVNFSFQNIEGESIGGDLEDAGIFTSTGSACLSNSLEMSHVLKAMGLSPIEVNSSLRISLGKYNTEEEINYFLEKLPKVVERLRKISPLANEIKQEEK